MFNLVTGATGFVGGHLVSYLLERREPVRVFVRRAEQAARFRRLGVEVIIGDLGDRQALAAAVRAVKVVYHCAAARELASDDEIRSTNLDGVRDLLHAVCDASCRRLILLNPLNVLGACSAEVLNEERPFSRTGVVYSDVSIDAESLGLQFFRDRSVEVTILRPGLVYGPGDRHLPTLASALRRGAFTFPGSQHNVVPLLFIRDLVELMVRVVPVPVAAGRVYNVTDGACTTAQQLLATLAESMSCEVPRRVCRQLVPNITRNLCRWVGWRPAGRTTISQTMSLSRPVDVNRVWVEVGFRPSVPLLQGLQATLPWLHRSLEQGLWKSRAA